MERLKLGFPTPKVVDTNQVTEVTAPLNLLKMPVNRGLNQLRVVCHHVIMRDKLSTDFPFTNMDVRKARGQ